MTEGTGTLLVSAGQRGGVRLLRRALGMLFIEPFRLRNVGSDGGVGERSMYWKKSQGEYGGLHFRSGDRVSKREIFSNGVEMLFELAERSPLQKKHIDMLRSIMEGAYESGFKDGFFSGVAARGRRGAPSDE